MKKREDMTSEELRADNERLAREANQRQIEDRLQRLNAIANQTDETKQADGMEDLDDEAWDEQARARPPHNTAGEDDKSTEQLQEEVEEAREAGADDVRVTNGVTHYRLVINGQERWMTLEQLRTHAGKVAAADEYLRDAKEAAKRVIEAPSTKDESSEPDEDRVRDLFSSALMGEQSAIVELARLITSRPSEVTPDVVKAVDERIESRLTFREAADWFNREYANELSDPDLREYIVDLDAKMAAQNPSMDYKDRLKAVGEKARKLRGGTADASKTPTKPREDKAARKASLRTVVQAAGRPYDNPDDDEGEESYEQAIAKMAASRGQARPVSYKRN